mgnify:CR=1 FL=1
MGLTFAANFKPMRGGLDCFCTFIAGSPGKTSRICNIDCAAIILKMNDCVLRIEDWVIYTTSIKIESERKVRVFVKYDSIALSFPIL